MKPGIHADVPEADYFADPALSQSQAKTLLDCPARYRWELNNPREHSDAFDIGHAVHAKVLGVGALTVVVESDSWRSKAAREAADEARTEGATPLLRKDADLVDAMAEAVLTHPLARAILEAEGKSEQSMFWTDPDTGVQCRGRIDRVTAMGDGTPFLVDLKTTVNASPEDFGRSIAKFGYGLQDDWYSTGYEAITGERPAFGFIAVEKAQPHFVSVGGCDDDARRIGRDKRIDALEMFQRCTETDTWPAYGEHFITYPTPRWAR